MACAGHYHGLLNVIFNVEVPNLYRAIEAVEDRHCQVHQDQTVRVHPVVEALRNLLQGVHAAIRSIHDVLDTGNVDLADEGAHHKDVVGFVIHN